MQAPFLLLLSYDFCNLNLLWDKWEKPASLYVIWKDTSDGNTYLVWREKG